MGTPASVYIMQKKKRKEITNAGTKGYLIAFWDHLVKTIGSGAIYGLAVHRSTLTGTKSRMYIKTKKEKKITYLSKYSGWIRFKGERSPSPTSSAIGSFSACSHSVGFFFFGPLPILRVQLESNEKKQHLLYSFHIEMLTW